MDNWEANNAAGDDFPDLYEIKIPLETIRLNPESGRTPGIAFSMTDTYENWEFWPKTARLEDPSTWGRAELR